MNWVADKQKFISHCSGGLEVQDYWTERFNICLRCASPLKAIFTVTSHGKRGDQAFCGDFYNGINPNYD